MILFILLLFTTNAGLTPTEKASENIEAYTNICITLSEDPKKCK